MKECGNTTTTYDHIPCHLPEDHRVYTRCCSGLFDGSNCEQEDVYTYEKGIKSR